MTQLPPELRDIDSLLPLLSDGEKIGTRTRYCWVDENNERVSGVFLDIGAALTYLRTYPDKLASLESKMRYNRDQLAQREEGHGSYVIVRIQDIYASMERLTRTGLPPDRLVRLVTIGYYNDPSVAEVELIEHLRSEAPEYRALPPRTEPTEEN